MKVHIDKLKNCYNHLTGIQFTEFDKSNEISVLIGTDNPLLIWSPLHVLENVTRLGSIWWK